MSIRVAKFEIVKTETDTAEARQRWHELSECCQQMTNLIWQTWLVWHVTGDSANRMKAYLDSLDQWRTSLCKSLVAVLEDVKDDGKLFNEIVKKLQATEAVIARLLSGDTKAINSDQQEHLAKFLKAEKRPKCDIVAVSAELSKHIRQVMADKFPEVNNRVKELLFQSTTQKIKQRKAAKGKLSGWMAILLCHESLPSTTKQQPIPFDCCNAHLMPPMEDGENWKLRLRIDRVERPGKSPATSTLDTVHLLTRKKGIRSQTAVLEKIAAGDYKFCGSSLAWNSGKKKWFALVCYQMPPTSVTIDSGKSAILRPDADRPWILEAAGYEKWIGGRGHYVTATRSQLLRGRWSRQEGYRHASSSAKGHGHKRATNPLWILSRRWKEFVKRCNHNWATEVVRYCIDNGIGVLAYQQPIDELRDEMFLTMTGKIGGRQDSTGWDWYQMSTLLGYRCEREGIRLIVEKRRGEKGQKNKGKSGASEGKAAA